MHKKVFSYLWTSASLLEKLAFYKELILSLHSVEPILLCLKLYCKTPSSSWLLHTSLKHHHNAPFLSKIIWQNTSRYSYFPSVYHILASISLIQYKCTTECPSEFTTFCFHSSNPLHLYNRICHFFSWYNPDSTFHIFTCSASSILL